jgi:hypothetical protein
MDPDALRRCLLGRQTLEPGAPTECEAVPPVGPADHMGHLLRTRPEQRPGGGDAPSAHRRGLRGRRPHQWRRRRVQPGRTDDVIAPYAAPRHSLQTPSRRRVDADLAWTAMNERCVNTMRLPPLSAESSLYRTNVTYRLQRSSVGQAGDRGLMLPQFGPALLARRQGLFLRGSRWTIGGVGLDGADVCACLQVCDGNGNNCTPCTCDPPGCGTC